jgi:hypothetical protein
MVAVLVDTAPADKLEVTVAHMAVAVAVGMHMVLAIEVTAERVQFV